MKRPLGADFILYDRACCGGFLGEIWHELLWRFRQDMKARNYSEGTISGRMYGLNQLLIWCEEQGVTEPSGLTPALVRNFRRSLSMSLNRCGRPNSARTMNMHLTNLKTFCKFLLREGEMGIDPAANEEYGRKTMPLPRAVLTEKEVQVLLNSLDSGTVVGWRDRIVIELLYSCGIRRNEAVGLDTGDVDNEEGFLHVRHGKGGKSRMVPLGRRAGHVVSVYITEIRPSLVRYPEEKALILSRYGFRLGKRGIAGIVARAARSARISQNVTPHTFRHTFATHLVKNRANICHVQEMLGHASLNTTMIYTRMAPMELKEEHEKYHPRENWKE